MFRGISARLVTKTVRSHRYVKKDLLIQQAAPAFVSLRSLSDAKDEAQQPFDASLLEFLVCPLSKKTLRYEAQTNELINEELGIAYPIVDGIPNMIPQEARLLQKDPSASPSSEPSK